MSRAHLRAQRDSLARPDHRVQGIGDRPVALGRTVLVDQRRPHAGMAHTTHQLARAGPGESLSATAVRETLEETGISVQLTDVAGIYSDPRHVIHYTSDDEVRQEFTVVYRAAYVSGEPTPSSETTEVAWVPVAAIPDLPMDRSQRMRIQWALGQDQTWIDPTGD